MSNELGMVDVRTYVICPNCGKVISDLGNYSRCEEYCSDEEKNTGIENIISEFPCIGCAKKVTPLNPIDKQSDFYKVPDLDEQLDF